MLNILLDRPPEPPSGHKRPEQSSGNDELTDFVGQQGKEFTPIRM